MSQVTLKVSGMKCGGCVSTIKDALLDLKGVEDVTVRLAEGEVCVDFQGATVSEMEIKQVIRGKGYSVD